MGARDERSVNSQDGENTLAYARGLAGVDEKDGRLWDNTLPSWTGPIQLDQDQLGPGYPAGSGGGE